VEECQPLPATSGDNLIMVDTVSSAGQKNVSAIVACT